MFKFQESLKKGWDMDMRGGTQTPILDYEVISCAEIPGGERSQEPNSHQTILKFLPLTFFLTQER